MKLFWCVLLFLLRTLATSTYSSDVLSYVLRSIDFLESVHPGVFSCIFWDISKEQTNDNILYAVLESIQLDHVSKYVVKGSHRKALDQLPWRPSLLVIWSGDDVEHLEHGDTRANLSYSLQTKDPATDILVFVDLENPRLSQSIGEQIYKVQFQFFVLLDSQTMAAFQCNGFWSWPLSKAPQPMYLFTLYRRYMRGRNITYVKNEDEFPFDWNRRWVNETARYLKTEAEEYQHDCHGKGNPFFACLLQSRGTQNSYNIVFILADVLGPNFRHFRVLYTNLPLFMEIAVPRDRPLNVAELFLMPLSWPVWVLLVVILVASEVSKYLFPQHFTNNPTLLVVCGFERHNLHRAGRTEKVTFLSMIILMFFVSNAFETKFVSLMVNKPSIQRIRTLEDLANSELKFPFELEVIPHFANHSVIGQMVINGKSPGIYETMPGIAMLWYSDMAELRQELAFDYERMQPFYVLLDFSYMHSYEFYWTEVRYLHIDAFRYIHAILVEAGLIDLWKRQWRRRLRLYYIGSRPRADISEKTDLNFDDLQPAWMSLAIGLGSSIVAFLAERFMHLFVKRINC